MTSFAENSITASSSAAVCASAAACMTRGSASEIYIETIIDFTCQRMILANIIIGNIEILVINNKWVIFRVRCYSKQVVRNSIAAACECICRRK
jgi:hypothetical protein